MAPQVGLEPTTLRLTAECSAIELLRNKVHEVPAGGRRLNSLFSYNKRGGWGQSADPTCGCCVGALAIEHHGDVVAGEVTLLLRGTCAHCRAADMALRDALRQLRRQPVQLTGRVPHDEGRTIA